MDQSPPTTTKSSSSDDTDKFRSSTDTLTESAAVGNLIDLDSDHDDAFKPSTPKTAAEICIQSNDSGVSLSTGRSRR